MAAEHVERIGARIRERREELGLSRRRLVERMQGKVSENDLYRWERGQHRPGDDTLADLAKALDVGDASYFLIAEPAPGTGDLMGALSGDANVLARIETKLDAILGALERLIPPPADAPAPALESDERAAMERELEDHVRQADKHGGTGASRSRGRRAAGP